MRFRCLCCALGIAASLGCAHAPSARNDVERALQDAAPQGRIERLRDAGEQIAGTPFRAGNAVQLLRNGPTSYAAMRDAITSARHSIEMESYVFDQTEGSGFADLLIAAHARGVQVWLIYDAWGSIATPAPLFQRLRDAGIQVLEFSPIDPKTVAENLVDRRDHRKLLLVDGRLAVTGGVNISEVYLWHQDPQSRSDDTEQAPWRDTDIRIEGPAVAQYQQYFWQVWNAQNRAPQTPPELPVPAARGDYYVQVIANTPSLHQHAIYRSLIVAIALAQHSVHLTTGFFAPTPELLHALRAAARRGVDVALLLPSQSTSDAAIKAGRADYEDLLEDGVRIYEFQGRVLHAKTAVVDGDWCSIGSANLDWRSVLLNNELNTVILSSAFGQQMEAMFRDDTASAKAIDAATWNRRPLGEKLDEWRARLFKVFL